MNVVIFGANGKAGRVTVEMALKQGHEVTAFSRQKILNDDDKLKIVTGDALIPGDVERAIDPGSMVLSLLGHGKNTPVDVQTRAMEVITAVMRVRGATRIISLTGAGVFSPQDKPRLIDRAGAAALMFLDPYRFHDGITHVQVLRASQLDWTVVRTPKHTNGSRVGCRVGMVGPGLGLKVSRRAIAGFMLAAAQGQTYRHQLPAISN